MKALDVAMHITHCILRPSPFRDEVGSYKPHFHAGEPSSDRRLVKPGELTSCPLGKHSIAEPALQAQLQCLFEGHSWAGERGLREVKS